MGSSHNRCAPKMVAVASLWVSLSNHPNQTIPNRKTTPQKPPPAPSPQTPPPLRPTAPGIPEGNWYPVVVEVVDLVPGSISNMPLWMIGGWIVRWIVLWIILQAAC